MAIKETTGESAQIGVEISPRAAEVRKAVLEKLQSKRDAMIDSLQEAFNERVSYGGDQMSEMAKNKILIMRDSQIEEVRKTYDSLLNQFDQRIAKDSSLDMDALADELLESANNTVKQRLEKLKAILAKKVEGDFMTTIEVARIETAVKSIEKFEKNHPELHPLFVKISEGGSLRAEEFEQVIKLIQPSDLSKMGGAGPEGLETTAAGLLIGLMSPSQRFDLIKNLMESDKKEMTIDLMDAFLKTGVLTVMQGEELFKLAIEGGIITQEKYDAEYKEKIEGTYYSDELKKFREAMGSETAREMGGKYSKNIVERFVGMPMLHSLLMLWGGTTALVNILASRKKGDFAQTLKNIASNEFFWLGAGAAGVGYEGATGTIREGRSRGGVLDFFGLGEGNISAWLDKVLSDEDRDSTIKRNGVKVLAENYLGAPADFREYLENGGHSTIIKLKNQRDASGTPTMNLDKIMEAEENTGQKTRLERLKSLNGQPERKIDRMIFGVAVSAEALEIDESKEHLADWLKKIRETQIPT